MDASIVVALITTSGGIFIALIAAVANTERATRPLRDRIKNLERRLRDEGVDPDAFS